MLGARVSLRRAGVSPQRDALTLGMALGALLWPKLWGASGTGRGAARALSATGGQEHSPCPAACLDWGTRGSSPMGAAAEQQGMWQWGQQGHVAAARCREPGTRMQRRLM